MSDKMVEMEYTGPGTKPENIFVKASEVPGLESTNMWKMKTTKTKRKKVSDNG